MQPNNISYTNSFYSPALSILRSGHCSGNLTNSLDEFAVEALKMDVTTLLEIGKISPERKQYHNMEKNNIGEFNVEVFIAHESLTYMAILRLRDIEASLSQVLRNSLIEI